MNAIEFPGSGSALLENVETRTGGQLDEMSLKIYVTLAQFLPDDDVRCNDDAYFPFPWKRRAAITSTRVELVFRLIATVLLRSLHAKRE